MLTLYHWSFNIKNILSFPSPPNKCFKQMSRDLKTAPGCVSNFRQFCVSVFLGATLYSLQSYSSLKGKDELWKLTLNDYILHSSH